LRFKRVLNELPQVYCGLPTHVVKSACAVTFQIKGIKKKLPFLKVKLNCCLHPISFL